MQEEKSRVYRRSAQFGLVCHTMEDVWPLLGCQYLILLGLYPSLTTWAARSLMKQPYLSHQLLEFLKN